MMMVHRMWSAMLEARAPMDLEGGVENHFKLSDLSISKRCANFWRGAERRGSSVGFVFVDSLLK